MALVLLLSISFKQDRPYGKDFLEFWTTVKENYAYFDKKHTDWDKVKEVYLPLAESAKTKSELIMVLEKAIEELYDNHFSLNTNLQSSTRLVPSGSDLWAEWLSDKAYVTEVRRGFSADRAGIKPGMEISAINGVSVSEAVNRRIGKCIKKIDTEVRNYALRQLLAGTYLVPRLITFKQNGKLTTVNLDKPNGNLADIHRYNTLLESRHLDQNIGYIRFNNSLGETGVIRLFDSALQQLKNTDAMIIDLRETPGGGNSTVARGIMSRFIEKEMPYQKHVLPNEEREYGIKRSWFEIVSPRGPFTYSKPIVVLVNHWTGSMGEGIAIGFKAAAGALVVGTKMAALNGAISGFETSVSKIPYSFPTEQLYEVTGELREAYSPSYPVNLNSNSTGDLILDEGIKIVKQKLRN
ncbi:peptidase [Flavihumibacter sp. R14]|nr:peptidase [Flavihumibacter soli]